MCTNREFCAIIYTESSKTIQMTDTIQTPLNIAQKIDSIVNCNVPPEDDAGTISNLVNLIDDLNDYLETLTEINSNVGQQTLSL